VSDLCVVGASGKMPASTQMPPRAVNTGGATPESEVPMQRKPTVEERFWAKVRTTDTCWVWMGGRHSRGYGTFWNGQRRLPAHRWAYEHFVGPIPEGLEIDHLCRNIACVNPEHLEPVTHAENVRRGMAAFGIRQRAARITHCPHGHEYTPENTRVNYQGRFCRACGRARAAEKQAREVAERGPCERCGAPGLDRVRADDETVHMYCRRCHMEIDGRLEQIRRSQPPRRLTDEQVMEIRRRVAAGERQVDVGPDFGISQSQVSQIVRRVHYADV
jgi:hypothetical protein